MAVIYSKGRDGSLQELGRTKVVPNSLNPQCITKYSSAYHLRQCRICCSVSLMLALNSIITILRMLKLEEQDFLGEASCTLSQIVTKSNGSLTLDLICGEQSSGPTHALKSDDPFLVISKSTESGMVVPICKTEVIKDDHSPNWKSISWSIQYKRNVPPCAS
ncbi:hypothetical protein P3S68_005526 [Capsicum galapagoense]